MEIMECLGTNENGGLTIGGLSVKELAKEYGTPLYLMDEDTIRKNCREYKQSIDACYGNDSKILFAGKAFLCKYMCKILAEEGLGLDVVSGGELYTALEAGFLPENIYFHGSNKSEYEITYAIDSNVGRIVVDNIYELYKVNKYASSVSKIVDISFRVKPGIDAHTHDFVMTGKIDSKFGVALETGEAEAIYVEASKLENVNVVGIHCHIGSQIFDYAPFEQAAIKLFEFILLLKDKHNIIIDEINLGGGYGIKYTESDNPISYGQYIQQVSARVKKIADDRNVPLPKIVMEPGRSITGDAGITVYMIGAVKDIPNVRKYVSVDGGMTDNPRYTMYEAVYDAVLVDRPKAERTEVVTVSGKCCETDTLIKDIKLPRANVDELLAVLATGAYNYSMASNYNKTPRPPIVMVSEGKHRCVVERETYEDLLKNDRG